MHSKINRMDEISVLTFASSIDKACSFQVSYM